ncbi:MAG: peptidylprolyl isomerase [Bacteroidota bacterium]
MLYKRMVLLVVPLLLTIISCTPEQSKIVAEYGDYKIYLDEFEKAYTKNAGGLDKAKKDSIDAYKKFLDLLVNYKMKLRDAVVRGYKVNHEMQNELVQYKINIGTTLYLENTLVEPGIKELYERRKTEVLAAHISLGPDSTMNENQVVELGNKLIERINNGEDFAILAKEYSKDPNTKDRGGVVGWITAGQVLIKDIEDALYNTDPGKIYSKLLKSNVNYHIIKVLEKNPRKHALVASHILAAFRDTTGNVDTARAYTKILDVKKHLDAGEDFGEVAQKYSDDKWSAKNKGDLGSFTRGRMVPEFEEAAWKLKPGEVSPIVKSQFGYHIIKLKSIEPIPEFQQVRDELKEIYKRVKYKFEYDQLIEKLKKERNYKVNGGVVGKLHGRVDTIKVGPSYANSLVQNELGKEILFTTNTNKYIVDSLFSYLYKKGLYIQSKMDNKNLEDAIKQYTSDMLVQEKALEYDKENSTFADIMKDYEDGIYLFKILEDEVWSKVKVDSQMVAKYYEEVKQNYWWKERVEFKEIFIRKDSLMVAVFNRAMEGENFDSLIAKYSVRKGYENTPGYFGLVEIDANDLAKNAAKVSKIGGIARPFKHQDGYSIVKLIQRVPPTQKTFEEVQAELSSVLQEKETKKMEEEYLDKLKKLYKPKYYYEELVNAFKQK